MQYLFIYTDIMNFKINHDYYTPEEPNLLAHCSYS